MTFSSVRHRLWTNLPILSFLMPDTLFHSIEYTFRAGSCSSKFYVNSNFYFSIFKGFIPMILNFLEVFVILSGNNFAKSKNINSIIFLNRLDRSNYMFFNVLISQFFNFLIRIWIVHGIFTSTTNYKTFHYYIHINFWFSIFDGTFLFRLRINNPYRSISILTTRY